jgi:CubicO group peptidase (beta-lactamase class C family)
MKPMRQLFMPSLVRSGVRLNARTMAVGFALATGVLTSCVKQRVTTYDVSSASAKLLIYPGAEWTRVPSVEDAGYSRAGLDSVRALLAAGPSTGFMAVVGGRVLMEYGDLDTLSYLASVRKSILAMLYGNYVVSGKVKLDKSLAQMGMDDVGGLSPSEKEATIRDLLTARSGVYHEASNAGDDLASAPPRGSQKHGTYQLYSNWDFNAAGAAFELETGRNIYDALDTDLAKPIGMQDWRREIQRKSGDSTKSRYLAYHMVLSTRDMARIGLLMLRDGNWAGTQVVPQSWVKEIVRPVTPVGQMNPPQRRNGPFGYGYLWWIWDGQWNSGPYAGAYSGLGAIGQHITVLPALDLVVAHKTVPGGRSVSHDQFLRILDQLVKARCTGACPR